MRKRYRRLIDYPRDSIRMDDSRCPSVKVSMDRTRSYEANTHVQPIRARYRYILILNGLHTVIPIYREVVHLPYFLLSSST
jgi:hypothetical protein